MRAIRRAIVVPMSIGYKTVCGLLYFGDQIDARTALELGLVNRIVPLAELRQASLDYAEAPGADGAVQRIARSTGALRPLRRR